MRLAMNYDVSFTASPRNYRRLALTLNEFRPDVVHLHGQFFDLSWMAGLWARRRGVPAILTVHTALVHTNPVFAAALWLADMLLPKPLIATMRPQIVMIDRFMSGYIRRRYHPPEDRLVAIPVGIDPERFRGVKASHVREQFGLGERPVILSIGHVIPLRNRLALVRALPYLLEKKPDAVVLVVGTVYDEAFLHLADELGVRDSLIVTGGVPRGEVPAYVAAADVEGHDFQGYGLGTASLEVMAAQVPVVSVVRADNFPGFELRSWENIVIVPPDDPPALADAIIRLLEDQELAHRVGEGQHQLILERFSIEAVTAKYLELYERLLARHG
jgi:1,2-diacylglycerol 3-alpha-glucosyltransferase